MKIPCEPNVVTILEGFVRQYACSLTTNRSPEKSRAAHRTNSTCSNTSSSAGDAANHSGSITSVALCKEVVDGLRVSFDALLDLFLLYPEERSQYQTAKRKPSDYSTESSDYSANLLIPPIATEKY